MKKIIVFLPIIFCFNIMPSTNILEKLKTLSTKTEAVQTLFPKYVEVEWNIEKKLEVEYNREKVRKIIKRLENTIHQQNAFTIVTHNNQQHRAIIELERENKTINLQNIRIKILSFSKHFTADLIEKLEEEFAEEDSLEKYIKAIQSLEDDEKQVVIDFAKLVTEIKDILKELPKHIAKGYSDAKKEQLEKICKTNLEKDERPSYIM